ncbi:hypothetical protein [Caldisalinibacter kiritimatiensis]|uniref:Uncharacterized protein n=1 Tax=Caldisalinibacter kiritimatiensis TaxID=1304284 RepID=R1ASX8_9FIRM|nr:hypothetical protein [Caldisalinibacter kiritimatiensis]EOD00253.1 hypothetical protein L21TH_1727 [Caldisalinibacter kiritimatiensis]
MFIITDYEGRNIIEKDEVIEERYLYPTSWEKNLEQDNFTNWKKIVGVKAKESTENRKQKENEIERYNRFLHELKRFYDEYPYEYYQELQETLKELKKGINKLETKIKDREIRLSEIDRQINDYQRKIEEFKGEENLLNIKIQKYFEYIEEKDKKQRTEEDKYRVEERIKAIDNDIDKYDVEVKHINEKLVDINEDLRETNELINDIKTNQLYQEVKKFPAKHTDKSKEVLKQERQYLKDILNEKQSGRSEIENELKHYEQIKADLEIELNKTYRQAEYDIDERFIFPINGEDEIDRLINQINELKPKIDEIKKEFEKRTKEYNDKFKEYEIREKDFYEQYNDIYTFKKSLSLVKEELDREETELQKENTYISTLIDRCKKELKDIDNSINELERYNMRYSFLIDEVTVKSLSPEIIQDYPYKRKEIVKNLIEKLEELYINVDKLNEIVEKRKNKFIIFCEDNIKDIKLKKMAVKGVENKNKYNEILNWKTKLKDRISRTIKIAEDDMRQHDEELQHFINHLHTYLSNLAEELRMIPKKTKVKIDGRWKEIYIFDVPSWDEQEGKEELRKHIDWMVSQLEGDTYKDENGKEDYALIKKNIEKWLQSKQLLKNVMKSNEIKVKCRKVTNDGKVNSAPHSWERSNKWSGGEKWSKNMALFLGILNYLAEKRQHISVNKKRNRTVIMDNPFGKASSDHVLDPVFFIAEQLGFQIIALTAHAEGKFIRNYFPVVYSCKLRPSVNNESLIITKEKEIRYTFFKDNDPQSLERLGEQEQLSLFET